MIDVLLVPGPSPKGAQNTAVDSENQRTLHRPGDIHRQLGSRLYISVPYQRWKHFSFKSETEKYLYMYTYPSKK